MWNRLRYWISFKLMGWPNVTGFLWTAVTCWAIWTRDPDLFQRAGALCLFAAFWKLTMVLFSLEEKKDINHGVDLAETRARYSNEPTYKSEGAKELWAKTRKSNTKFWETADKNRETIEESIAERARGALLGGVIGSLQLGFGDLLLTFGLKYIEN